MADPGAPELASFAAPQGGAQHPSVGGAGAEILRLRNVSATLAGVAVLRAITVSIGSGSIAAIVGRNGAGKTTLLRVIMGLLPAHRDAQLHLEGHDLRATPAHRRSALGIGYAPEERILFPTFSVEENLRFPCEVIGMRKVEIDARLDEVLAIVPEVKAMLGRSAAALSGGQGKMTALGRALMVATKLVMLDEPFQGLAPVLAARYAESLQRLRSARPRLAIVITESNAALLKEMPDLRLTLERGALAGAHASGPHPNPLSQAGEGDIQLRRSMA